MKKVAVLFLLFVLMTLLATSCMVGLRGEGSYRDGNGYYRNNPNSQYYDNRGNTRFRGNHFRDRDERRNRNYDRHEQNKAVLIIR